MVLDVDGQALFLGLQRGPLGHRPALQHAVHLQTNVVMQAPGSVLLNDEQATVATTPGAEGLGRALGIALVPVGVEWGGHNP